MNKTIGTFLTIGTMVIFVLFGWGRKNSAVESGASRDADSVDLGYAPKPFNKGKESYVSIDILSSSVKWTVRQNLTDVKATARLKFQVQHEGFPLFLLNPNAKVLLGKKPVEVLKMAEAEFSQSSYFALMEQVSPGQVYEAIFNYSFAHDPINEKHILPLQYYFHKFVERGIPANGSYDHYPLDLEITVEDEKEALVFANGEVKKLGTNHYNLQFPDFFTSLSFFIDVTFANQVQQEIREVKSMDGRNLQVMVYSDQDPVKKWLSTFAGIIEYTFYEMEKLLGPYPQKTIILKVSDKEDGGGAYAGAMVLSSDYMEHISHELGHSWFLQGVTPARGEDSWIYEGFGNWAPLFGSRSGFAKDLNMKNSIRLNQGDFKLWATKEAFPLSNLRTPHQTGSMVLASIDQYIKINAAKPNEDGGLIPILKKIASEKKHQTMSTKEFQQLLEKHTGLDFSELFSFYLSD